MKFIKGKTWTVLSGCTVRFCTIDDQAVLLMVRLYCRWSGCTVDGVDGQAVLLMVRLYC